MTQSVPGNPARTFTVRAEISGRTEVGPTRADNQDAIMIASAVGTASGTRLTRASTTQVAVAIANGEMQFQTPPCWQARVRTVLESL